jgi:hypothetical protein
MDVGQRLGVEFELLPESVHLGFIGNEVLRRSAVFCAVSDVLRHASFGSYSRASSGAYRGPDDPSGFDLYVCCERFSLSLHRYLRYRVVFCNGCNC